MNGFSILLTDKLVNKKIIQEEDYEVYRFGIECFIMKACHIISYLVMGLCFRKIWELLIFLITFIPLRVYAGGYHAKTPLRCYIVSCGAVLSAIVMIQNVPLYVMHNSIIWAVVTSLILFIIIPVESSNKPLDDIEKAHYKKKAGIMIIIDLSFVIIFRMFEVHYISFIVSLSLTFELGIALLGKLLRDSQE